MSNELGVVYGCPLCGSRYLVFEPGAGELECCRPLQPGPAPQSAVTRAANHGQRYRCDNCGTAALCLNSGDTDIHCCDRAMMRFSTPSLPPVG